MAWCCFARSPCCSRSHTHPAICRCWCPSYRDFPDPKGDYMGIICTRVVKKTSLCIKQRTNGRGCLTVQCSSLIFSPTTTSDERACRYTSLTLAVWHLTAAPCSYVFHCSLHELRAFVQCDAGTWKSCSSNILDQCQLVGCSHAE